MTQAATTALAAPYSNFHEEFLYLFFHEDATRESALRGDRHITFYPIGDETKCLYNILCMAVSIGAEQLVESILKDANVDIHYHGIFGSPLTLAAQNGMAGLPMINMILNHLYSCKPSDELLAENIWGAYAAASRCGSMDLLRQLQSDFKVTPSKLVTDPAEAGYSWPPTSFMDWNHQNMQVGGRAGDDLDRMWTHPRHSGIRFYSINYHAITSNAVDSNSMEVLQHYFDHTESRYRADNLDIKKGLLHEMVDLAFRSGASHAKMLDFALNHKINTGDKELWAKYLCSATKHGGESSEAYTRTALKSHLYEDTGRPQWFRDVAFRAVRNGQLRILQMLHKYHAHYGYSNREFCSMALGPSAKSQEVIDWVREIFLKELYLIDI